MTEILNTENFNGATKEDLDTLTQKVEAATEEFGKIKAKNDCIKQAKKDFTEHLLNAFHQQFNNVDLKREEKLLKGLFNKIVKARTNPDLEGDDKTLIAGYIRKRVEEMVMLVYAFRFLKYNDVTKIFESYGIKLEFDPIETKIKYFEGTNFKETMKEFVEQATAVRLQTEEIDENIKETIYNEIPATLKYNKNVNPTGITKGVFKKFSLLNLLKKINVFKAKRKYEDMVNETETRNKADTLAVSIADTLVSDGKEAI